MSGSSSTEQSGTQTTVNQIPQWMQDAGQQNYAFAQDVANKPLQQYQGQMVADVSPQTQQSWDLAAGASNTGADQFNSATAGYLSALGQTPQSVSAGGPTQQVTNPGNAGMIRAGQISNTNLNPYYNPYTQSVINTSLPIMQQALGLSQNQQQNAANSANAFGGSRQAIQQAVTQAQGAQDIGNMAAQLNSANFAQAQSAAQQDIANRLSASTANQAAQQTNLNRNLTAQQLNQTANAADLDRALKANQGNQTAAQQKINSDILASQGLTNTGDTMNKANAANFNMLQSAGAAQQAQAQSQIGAQMAKFDQAQNYPSQQLATLLSALGMTPHDTSTTGTSSQTSTTPTDWIGLAESGAKTLGSLWSMSDVKVKKNISSKGVDPITGIPIKSFNYKSQPIGAPKVIGPLAQDVEKAIPGSTAKIGGVMAVPKPILAAATPSVAKSPAFVTRASPGGLMAPAHAAGAALTSPRAGAKAFPGSLANTKLHNKRMAIRGALG